MMRLHSTRLDELGSEGQSINQSMGNQSTNEHSSSHIFQRKNNNKTCNGRPLWVPPPLHRFFSELLTPTQQH